MDTTMRKENRKKWALRLLWAFLILTPVLAAVIPWHVTGNSPLHMDAFNTTWDDEVGYFRVIRMMRRFGRPVAVPGYNEVTGIHMAYGAYSPLTYLPAFFFSFFTGTSSRNYMIHVNVLMLVCTLALTVCLLRPDKSRTLVLSAFFLLHPILIRFAWSGMNEMSFVLFYAVVTAIMLRALEGRMKGKYLPAVIIVMSAIIAFWGCMRPYLLAMAVLPLYLIWRRGADFDLKRRIILTAVVLAMTAAAFNLFFYMSGRWTTPYFEENSRIKEFIKIVLNEPPSVVLRETVQRNVHAFSTLAGSLKKGTWSGIVAALFLAEWILLGIGVVYAGRRRGTVPAGTAENPDRGKCGMKNREIAADILLMIAAAASFESNIVVYNPLQIHRMMLGMTVSLGIWLIVRCRKAGMVLLLPMFILFILTLRGESSVKLGVPAMRSYSVAEDNREILEKELADIIPPSEDPWDSTVAKPFSQGVEYVRFMLPENAALNVFTREKMTAKIESGTLMSRFILIKDDDEIYDLCSSRFEEVWKFRHMVLLQTRP